MIRLFYVLNFIIFYLLLLLQSTVQKLISFLHELFIAFRYYILICNRK